MTVIMVDDKNFKKEVEESKNAVIIDFWAPWCGPCQMMGPIFESLSSKYEGKLKFIKINSDEEPQISSKFNIQGIPTLIIVNKSKEVDRIVGFASENVLKSKIDKILNSI